MKKILKNIDLSKVLNMASLVEYQQGQIVSKTLVQNEHVSITLFAFEKDEEISTHQSEGDALVMVLDGETKVTIGGEQFVVKKEETIVMPARTPHAVYATQQFKMLLIVVF